MAAIHSPPPTPPSLTMSSIGPLRKRDIARDMLETLAKHGLDLDEVLNDFIIQRSCAIIARGMPAAQGTPAARVDDVRLDVPIAMAIVEPIIATEVPAPVAAIPYNALLRPVLLKMCTDRGLNVGARGFHHFTMKKFIALLEADDVREAEEAEAEEDDVEADVD